MDATLTYRIIGAAMAVHRELGPGFLEAAYHRAFLLELHERGLPADSEVPLELHYRGRPLGVPFRADVVVAGVVLVELKALPAVGGRERRQVQHYLRCTGMEVGLLLNFGEDSLHVERIGPRIPAILANPADPRPPVHRPA